MSPSAGAQALAGRSGHVMAVTAAPPRRFQGLRVGRLEIIRSHAASRLVPIDLAAEA
ncbi:MAG: hypothetical protein IT317_07540 [Anaerolineales bacterium]|nr:hypothetical protein [Anaerolineales bacterium]